MIEYEGPFRSEKEISEIFSRHLDVLERLREKPVKVVVDGGYSTGVAFVVEVSNKGFKFTFAVTRQDFSQTEFRELLVDVLTGLGIAVED